MNANAKLIDRTTVPRARIGVLIALTVVTALAMLAVPPIRQSQAYHNFLDQRAWLGVPNFLNVVSNVPFLAVGMLGLVFLLRKRQSEGAFLESSERWAYVMLFLGLALTCFGSAYYHLSPNNERLVWDRLPMTIVFMSLFAAVIAERISQKGRLLWLSALLAVGVGSVVYWHLGEQAGRGDLRLYVMVQFYSMVAILLIAILFPSRYTRGADIFGVVAIYAMAKLAELADSVIFDLGGIVSGHTLKHVIAAVCGYWILRMLKLRKANAQVLKQSYAG